MKVSQVPEYLRVRLSTVTTVEAATAVVARLAWHEPSFGVRIAALRRVDDAWRVRTPSAGLRDASDLRGRSLLRTVAAVWDLGSFTAGPPWCRAVAMGATGAVTGLSAGDLARLLAYEDVQTDISAAMKLDPFDPAVAVRWAASAESDVETLVERVTPLTSVNEIPGFSGPQIGAWAEVHRFAEKGVIPCLIPPLSTVGRDDLAWPDPLALGRVR